MPSTTDDFYKKDYTKKWNGLTLALAKKIGDDIGADWSVIDLGEFLQGIKEEMEHGKDMDLTMVHEDDYTISAKIALAHLLEVPDYYTRLEQLEHDGEEAYPNEDAVKAWVANNKQKYSEVWQAADADSKKITEVPKPCRVCVDQNGACGDCSKCEDCCGC